MEKAQGIAKGIIRSNTTFTEKEISEMSNFELFVIADSLIKARESLAPKILKFIML